MENIAARLKHEIAQVIPPAVFFFVTFNVIAVTRALMLEQYGITVPSFAAATIGALIVAKVILIVDLLPFVNRYPDKPLVYNVAWKTLIYVLAALLVRYVEHLISFARKHDSLLEANRHLLAEVIWPHFWAVQIWLALLLLIYCALRELARSLGGARVRHMFFGVPGQKATP
jgi:hypothetical protein